VTFIPDDVDDLKDFLTPTQWEQLQKNLKAKGKVLVRGVPLIPEESKAETQGDWSCAKMRRKKWGGLKYKKKRYR
jgi:hypothetical protein